MFLPSPQTEAATTGSFIQSLADSFCGSTRPFLSNLKLMPDAQKSVATVSTEEISKTENFPVLHKNAK